MRITTISVPRPMAERADKYALYQRSVQDVETDAQFLIGRYEDVRGRPPAVLREDFCAAAALACEWVKTGDDRIAFGLDLDPEPLAWGRAHNAADLTPEQTGRLRLLQQDVLEPVDFAADVIYAGNFSYCCFRDRSTLLRYFRQVMAGLAPEGIFVLDIYGGPHSQEPREEETDHGDFSYVWDQDEVDPISGHVVNYIHFRFPDGSAINKAFTYEWRLWTLPELRELLAEAGFADVTVFWETADENGEGTGEYEPAATATQEDAWIAYLVAVSSITRD